MALYLLFIICIGLVEGVVSHITIGDESIVSSPRLYGRSVVVYNYKIYVYGGKHSGYCS